MRLLARIVPDEDQAALRRGSGRAARGDGPLPRLPRPGRARGPRPAPGARARRGAGGGARRGRRPGRRRHRGAAGRGHAPGRARRGGGGRAPRVHGAVPADLRPGDGQGDRGHRVLPLRPAHRAQRGGWRPRPPRRSTPTELHAFAARQLGDLADHDDDADHPRHEAVRGRPRPAVGPRRAAGGVGDLGARDPRPRRSPPWQPARPGHRVLPPPDRRRRVADRRRIACRPTPPRRFARRSSTRPGWTRTTPTRPTWRRSSRP